MSCPICNKERDAKYRPFCSKRCADVDLAKWLNGSYVLSREITDEDEVDISKFDPTEPKYH